MEDRKSLEVNQSWGPLGSSFSQELFETMRFLCIYLLKVPRFKESIAELSNKAGIQIE